MTNESLDRLICDYQKEPDLHYASLHEAVSSLVHTLLSRVNLRPGEFVDVLGITKDVVDIAQIRYKPEDGSKGFNFLTTLILCQLRQTYRRQVVAAT